MTSGGTLGGARARFWHIENLTALAAIAMLIILGTFGQLRGTPDLETLRLEHERYARWALATANISRGLEPDLETGPEPPEATASGQQEGLAASPAPLWPALEDHRVFSALVEGDPGSPRGDIRAIYLTGASAGDQALMRRVFELVASSELNALVIDVKDNSGRTTYRSQLPEVQALGGSSGRIQDIAALLRTCEENGIYTIGRLVTFADPLLANARPDLAVQTTWGGVWCDHTGHGWTNPYSTEVWEYNLAIAREVAALGFREIQFDYVRFPSDGNLKIIRYPVQTDQRPAEVIESFLKRAKEELSPYGAFVAADVFGLVTTFTNDMTIGQILENVARQVDFVCPMMYPSHYALGNYGLPDPDAEPYLTIRAGLTDALRRLPGQQVRLRPWLQDFSWRHSYGVAEVKAQIQAARELGVVGYMLWNPRNVYTEGAIRHPQL